MARLGDTTVFGGLKVTGWGILDTNLSTGQSNAENGIYVNFAETVNINQGFNIISDSEVSPINGGIFQVSFNVNFHRTGSSLRNIMYAEIEKGGNKLSSRTRGLCYIRNSGEGDEGDATDTAILELSGGESIRIWANEEGGGETGNDIERANISIQQLE